MTKSHISSVAIIGAGVSGVTSAGHLLAAGLKVTVFERNSAAEGVWLYDERQPIEPRYPAIKASVAEEVYVEQSNDHNRHASEEQILKKHAPPG